MKKILSLAIIGCLFLGISACGSEEENDKKIVVGASTSPHAMILNFTKDQLEKEGYTLEVIEYDDYVMPNTSLDNGELDANYFQHYPYLKQFNKDHDMELENAGFIHFEPLGIYSYDTTERKEDFNINDIKEGATIAVPDDPSNAARALLLLADAKIITLKDGVEYNAKKADIIVNSKNVVITEVDSASIPVLLQDYDYAVINGNYALSGKVTDKVIRTEAKDSKVANDHANVIAVQKGKKDSEKIKALLKALTSDETKKFIEKEFKNIVYPVF